MTFLVTTDRRCRPHIPRVLVDSPVYGPPHWVALCGYRLSSTAIEMQDVRGRLPVCAPCASAAAGPCVYVARTSDGSVLYVGVTKNLLKRLRQHARSSWWWGDATEIETVRESTIWAAVRREQHLIRLLRPLHNKQSNLAREQVPA